MRRAVAVVIGLAVIVVQVCCMPPLNAQPRRPSHCPMRAKQCPAAKRTCSETPRQLITAPPPAPALTPQTTAVTAIGAPPLIAHAPHASEPSHCLTPTRTIQLRI